MTERCRIRSGVTEGEGMKFVGVWKAGSKAFS